MNTEKINPEGDGSGADMPTGEKQAVPVKSLEQDPRENIPQTIFSGEKPSAAQLSEVGNDPAEVFLLPDAQPFGERSPEVVAEQTRLQEPEPAFGARDIATAKAALGGISKQRAMENTRVLMRIPKEAREELGLPAMQSQMDAQGLRLQKLIDALKAQGGVLHEEI